MKRSLAVVVAIALAVAARPAGAWPIVLPRAGQVGFGLDGTYGAFVNGGNLGSEFGHGGVLAMRLVYRMRYERAIGLSFEEVKLDTRHETADSSGAFPAPLLGSGIPPIPRKSLLITTEGFDLYQYFGTRTKTHRFLRAGLGLAQVSAKQVDGETIYPLTPDGFYLMGGAGIERFVYRSWAVDAGARYMALILDGKVNHDIRAQLGLVLYAAY